MRFWTRAPRGLRRTRHTSHFNFTLHTSTLHLPLSHLAVPEELVDVVVHDALRETPLPPAQDLLVCICEVVQRASGCRVWRYRVHRVEVAGYRLVSPGRAGSRTAGGRRRRGRWATRASRRRPGRSRWGQGRRPREERARHPVPVPVPCTRWGQGRRPRAVRAARRRPLYPVPSSARCPRRATGG